MPTRSEAAGKTGQVEVSFGDAPPMSANLRVSGPGTVTMSFRLNPNDNGGGRLVGDTATVNVTATDTTMLVEVVSVSVMGYVEVCEAKIVRHVSGPPFGGGGERRGSVRHQMSRPVEVQIAPNGGEAAGRSATGKLGDISIGGCGLELTTVSYRMVGAAIESTISFSLPGAGEPFALSARRRNTRSVGTDLVWMGMLWSDTTGDAGQLRRLAAHLDGLTR
ncbi:MAG: PilZ domain-containing protein [Actinomycetota bacterium]